MEQKEGRGAVFTNDKKGNNKAPDGKGYIIWKGEKIAIAMWAETSKKGVAYYSLQAQEWKEKSETSTNNLPF